MKKFVALAALSVMLLLFAAPAAVAQVGTLVPNFPSWWKAPPAAPDGVTRTQYHSFQANPEYNVPPDYTYNGFTPSVPDDWTLPDGLSYSVNIPGGTPYPFYNLEGRLLGNDYGGYLANPDSELEKLMGNALRPSPWYKEFFVAVFWQGPGTLDIDVDPAYGLSWMASYGGVGNWHAIFLNGTIIPQPASETFSFHFNRPFPGDMQYIDSIFVGTHCAVPEPGTLALLATAGLGVLAYAWRRRRS